LLKIIDMDVRRSYNKDPNFPKEKLKEILNVSSYLLVEDWGYC